MLILTNYIPLGLKHTLGGLAQGSVVLEVGVVFKVFVGFGEGGSHKLTILAHIGDIEAERSALSDRGVARKGKEVARTAQFEVLLGDLKAVVGVAHRLQSLLGGLAKATARAVDQNAVGLSLSASYSTAQLVKLGKTEAFGILDDHKAGAGHVDSNLNYGSGDQYLHLARGEAAHYSVLVCLMIVENAERS